MAVVRPAAGGLLTTKARTLAVALVPIAALGALCLFDLPICPTRGLLGIPCPGCGLVRATRALFALDFATAMTMHPLVFVLAPLAAYVLGRHGLVAAGVVSKEARDPVHRVPTAVWALLSVGMVGLWTARLVTHTHPDAVTFCSSLVVRLVGATSLCGTLQ